jgi:hypothetical protein
MTFKETHKKIDSLGWSNKKITAFLDCAAVYMRNGKTADSAAAIAFSKVGKNND